MILASIFLSALAGAGFGALWFSRFGAAWRAAAGLSEADVARIGRGGRPYAVAFAANLIAAGAMRHMFASGGYSGPFSSLLTGF
jgi:hypothetical protein